jgi:hypothetical protein
LEKVNGEALMTAAGQNVKRLLTFGRKGPRRPAQVAALRVPEAARRSPHRTPSPLRDANFRRSEPFSTSWQAKDSHSNRFHPNHDATNPKLSANF